VDNYVERGVRVYNGSLGQSPQRGPEAEPLVRQTKSQKSKGFVTGFGTTRREAKVATLESSWWSPFCLTAHNLDNSCDPPQRCWGMMCSRD